VILDLPKRLRVVYRNYRGEVSTRTIEPKRLWLGSTEWHPEVQLLLDAHDCDKSADRTFAVRDFLKTERAE